MPSRDIAVDLSAGQQVARPKRPFKNAKTWKRTDLKPSDWTVKLGKASLKELDAVVAELRRQNLPLHMLRPDLFKLTATIAHMKDARKRAYNGIGFAIVDRLPLDKWSLDEAKAVQWLILSTISQPVAQESSGQIFRDIRPAATMVEIRRLVDPDMLVEIEVEAVVGEDTTQRLPKKGIR